MPKLTGMPVLKAWLTDGVPVALWKKTENVAPAEPAGAWRTYYEQWPFALQPHDAPLWDVVPELQPTGPTVDAPTFSKWGPELAAQVGGSTLLLAGVYPLRALRVARNSRREGMSPRASAAWGLSCAFSSFPEAVGMAKYHVDRLFQRAPKIIEYKGPEAQ